MTAARLLRSQRRVAIALLAALAMIAALACDNDGAGEATSTATPATTSAAIATPIGDPLTADEALWEGMAVVVGAGAVPEALDAIARDREDAGGLFAAVEADGGALDDAIPQDAPGRFAGPHAALLAARADLAAFRADGVSRAASGTEYDALLAAYEEALIDWATAVGLDPPSAS